MFEKLKSAVGLVIEKISRSELSSASLDPLLWDFKISLVENDVALSVADQLCDEVKGRLLGETVGRFENKKDRVNEALRDGLYNVLQAPVNVDLLEEVAMKRRERTPLIIVFVGVNGTGKTTTIAKVANLLLKNGYSVVLAGSDTYRAGSIEQLEGHAKRLGVRVIKHPYRSDAAAVAFDAINYARSHGINVVLVDTAGRMQTNRNLIDEMKKIVKVAKPHFTLLVVDALAGNDSVEQARIFDDAVGINGVILTKLDADVKGGAAISIASTIKKPILYLGTGQLYDDLTSFDPRVVVESIVS
jgi:fused signal recognition particle receptor